MNETPILLWNHRWEYDKNPTAFFETLFKLAEEDLDFKLIVLGESYKKMPPIFKIAKEKLADKLLHWGYAKTFEEYAKWLWRADILPVTSNQDFFGGSVVEAIYCNCLPLLPKRLAYREHIPQAFYADYFYEKEEAFYLKLKTLLLDFSTKKQRRVQPFVNKYEWQKLINIYDKKLNISHSPNQ